jgi:archaellum biogenesis ATPase FlaH
MNLDGMNKNKSPIQVPGILELIGRSGPGNKKTSDNAIILPPSLFLLTGPSGVGKSVYCRQFIRDSLQRGAHCIFLSAAMNARQFVAMFPAELTGKLTENSSFINPFMGVGISGQGDGGNASPDKLRATLDQVRQLLSARTQVADSIPDKGNSGASPVCVVIDSLTEFFLLFDEVAVLKFITELCVMLKQFEVNAIVVLPISQASGSSSMSSFSAAPNILASVLDGTLEMKVEKETGGTSKSKQDFLVRSIRLVSMKGLYHEPTWVQFKITSSGAIVFGDSPSVTQNCTMCGKPISGTPIMESEFAFDSRTCVETYRRLVGIYGSSISDLGGLPSQVINVNFFFVDIVGLSNPVLSVKRQIEKIEMLNKLIASCDAYAKNKESKIILPTGDGMAIGFFTNIESPLMLSIQLHSKVREYNRNRTDSVERAVGGANDNAVEDDKKSEKLGIRIGLGSGPIFIVNDLKGNQNVWGPGIILARRVMDVGDDMHILLSGDMAQTLVALRDQNKEIIKHIGEYQIKHGLIVKVYSAFSDSFGNPNPPAKLTSVRQI